MPGTIKKGLIGREDLAIWDGGAKTFTRTTSDGYDITLTKIIMDGGGGCSGDSLSEYYCDLADAVAAIGSDDVSLCIDCACAVTETLVVPANINLRFGNGNIITVASGKTLTIHNMTDPGAFQIFAGAGTVELATAMTIYPEWWGAVADGTLAGAGTDSGALIQKAFDAAATGSKIKLTSSHPIGYFIGIQMLDISDATSRRLTVEGEATLYSTTTGKAFRVMSRSTTLRELTIQACTGYERSGVNHIGLEIANQTGSFYDHVEAQGFYKDFQLYAYATGQDPVYLETTKFLACHAGTPHYGWYLGTDATKWKSFATLEFYGCSAEIAKTETDNPAGVYPAGVYVGPQIDLYRGYMDISIHNKSTGSRAFEYHGRTHGWTARIMGECHPNQDPVMEGQYGIWIGNDAKRLYGDIETDFMACDIPYYRESTSAIIPSGIYKMENNGKNHIVWDQEVTTPFAFVGAGYYDIGTNIINGALEGATTTIQCSADHGLDIGDSITTYGLLANNPFFEYLNWESHRVLTTPTTTTFTIDMDTTEVPDGYYWTGGVYNIGAGDVADLASLRKSTVKFEVQVTALDYVQFVSSAGRISFLQKSGTDFSQQVRAIPVLTTHHSSDIALNDATPDISGVACLTLDNTLPTTITALASTTFGVAMNRILVVRHENSNTGMKHDATGLSLIGGQDVVGQAGMMQIFQLFDDAKGDPATACAFTALTDVVDTTPVAHGLSNNAKIIFTSIATTTGISEDTIYYVRNKTTYTFQVAATSGGTALPLTDDGTGTYYAHQDPTHWYWYEISRSYSDSSRGYYADRPTKPQIAQMYMCTDEAVGNVEKPMWWTGTKWILATGVEAAA